MKSFLNTFWLYQLLHQKCLVCVRIMRQSNWSISWGLLCAPCCCSSGRVGPIGILSERIVEKCVRAFLRLWLRNRNGNGTESSRTRRNQLLSLAETQQPILEILTIVLGHANQVVNDPVMYFWCFIDMTISFYWQCCQLCVFFGQKTEIYLWRNVELNFETRWTKM